MFHLSCLVRRRADNVRRVLSRVLLLQDVALLDTLPQPIWTSGYNHSSRENSAGNPKIVLYHTYLSRSTIDIS